MEGSVQSKGDGYSIYTHHLLASLKEEKGNLEDAIVLADARINDDDKTQMDPPYPLDSYPGDFYVW